MNIKRKVFATGKLGLSQSSELNSFFNINNVLENTRKSIGQFFKGNQIIEEDSLSMTGLLTTSIK
jgi:hypothetical protein